MSKRKAGHTTLEKLAEYTTIVADTGDIEAIRKFKPDDATTNPSLLNQAARMPQYEHLVKDAVAYGKSEGKTADVQLELTMDKLAVNFGLEILKIVPGYVSTEVDARISFDKAKTLARARRIIGMYEKAGVKRERILIKLASTWEGCQAAEELEKEGIHCNMTLLFTFAQAVAAAEAKATLISPFVGRIRDWYTKSTARTTDYPADEDPGVLSVQNIYNYYKKHGYATIVMGASFRSEGEILELAGCDRLTIAPKFLASLGDKVADVPRKLDPTGSNVKPGSVADKMSIDEAAFRWMLNEDQMATEKLSEGIRNFAKDTRKLEDFVKTLM